MFGFGNGSNRVDPKAAIAAVKNGEAVLIDVRTLPEFDSAHADGAISFELSRIASGHYPPIGKGDPLYVYCQSGGRSAQAAMLLGRAGYTNVQNLGGLQTWAAAGGPIVASDGPSVAQECVVQL